MTLALAVIASLMLAPAVAAPETPAPGAAPETRSCLALASIRGTQVVNARTVDFILRDSSVWRSRLPFECPQLGIERAFSYQTGMSQLCKQDVITVIQMTGGQPLNTRCGLGEFVRQPPKTKTRPKA